MHVVQYQHLRRDLVRLGYEPDIEWAENVMEVSSPLAFWREYAWVVLNSGMKNQVAERIWARVGPYVESGGRAADVFGHKGKAAAIDLVFANQVQAFRAYLAAPDKIAYLQTLPWIGPVTCLHLAKNFGIDVAKPDRHLVRIAGEEGVATLCRRLASDSGDRVATVDYVIWRAANLGLI